MNNTEKRNEIYNLKTIAKALEITNELAYKFALRGDDLKTVVKFLIDDNSLLKKEVEMLITQLEREIEK